MNLKPAMIKFLLLSDMIVQYSKKFFFLRILNEREICSVTVHKNLNNSKSGSCDLTVGHNEKKI